MLSNFFFASAASEGKFFHFFFLLLLPREEGKRKESSDFKIPTSERRRTKGGEQSWEKEKEAMNKHEKRKGKRPKHNIPLLVQK